MYSTNLIRTKICRLLQRLTVDFYLDVVVQVVRSIAVAVKTDVTGLNAFGIDQLAFVWRESIERLARRFFDNPSDIELLKRLDAAVGLRETQPFAADLWKVQNGYYRLLEKTLAEQRAQADQGDENAQVWVQHFVSLGERLSVKVP